MPYRVANGSTAVHVDIAEPDEGDFIALGYRNTGVVSGGVVTQNGTPNMTVQVAAAEIVIAGVPYTKGSGTVVLDPSTADPRFDIIGWDTGAGGVVALKGTPSMSNPVYPTFNPTSFCMTAAVYIPGGAVSVTDPYIVQKQAAPHTSLQRNYAADSDIGIAFATPSKPTAFKTLADGTISWVTSVLRRTADKAMEWATQLTLVQNAAADKALILKVASGAGVGNNILEVHPSASSTAVFSIDATGKLSALNLRTGSGSPEGVVNASRGTLYLNEAAVNDGTGNDAAFVKTTDSVATGWRPVAAYSVSNQVIPVGTVIDWPGELASLPTGWLYCNGSEQSSATYADLSTFCGTRFGTASAGNFKLPDYRGRTSFGVDGVLATATGQLLGQSTVTLLADQMPIHNHDVIETAHEHPQGGSYLYKKELAYSPMYAVPGNPGSAGLGVDVEDENFAHLASTGLTTDVAGGGQPFSVMQPSFSTYYLIKS